MKIPINFEQWTIYLWELTLVVWLLGMLRTRQTVRRQTSSSRLWQLGIIVVGAWLVFGPATGNSWFDAMALRMTPAVSLTGFLITAAGIGFAIWARIQLGANWSGTVTLKEGHTLVRRGPYRFVRHPIYTGILLGFVGTAFTRGTVHSFVGIVISAFGYWLKAQTEEQFMIQQFGQDYLSYRHEVRALVPFLF
jgi:protein-S-isoprenylcysteine O-methyltransferase Ste14